LHGTEEHGEKTGLKDGPESKQRRQLIPIEQQIRHHKYGIGRQPQIVEGA
jgi:hypothetical protein